MKKKIFLNALAVLFLTANICMAQYECTNWKNIKAAAPELEQVGLMATKTATEIESSPWSIGCETMDRDYTIFNNYKDYVGELGAKSARLQGGWAKCEKEKGVYSFNWLDEHVYGLEEQGVKPWISLSYGNPLYKSDPNLGSRIFSSEETLDAWCAWVAATVSRYKGTVNEWEVWNEPNYGNKGGETYAKLLMRTIQTIKEIQPDAVIIGFALSGTPLDFTREVFDILKTNNMVDKVDYLTYHPYAYNPDDSYVQVAKLKSLAESYNPKIKLFQGENAAPSDNHYVYHALKDYPWTEISQAKWYMRRMAGDRVRDIRTSVFGIIDMKYTEVLLSMGLLRSNLKQEVLYKKPAFYAVQHMMTFFDNSVIPIGESKFESSSVREMTVAGFKKNNTPVALVWYKDEIPSDELKWDVKDITIHNMNFKDPVYADMLSGKIYELKGDWKNEGKNAKFEKLPVWDSVMMIAERSEITFKAE
ncbi:glycoside hydrolase family protein [Kriegella aquimaris]|uniref:Glycosyl hydrolases family 39 n=1 Tax=Kriegella aquimaris TaxID=192904 RepID=A0A1G9TPB7_9FLAO|nr:hypothetical protein [Kriegella aquimaris]SDM49501.1 Glycosyl hydrolases family 39 [Kriegella aquimaris]